MPRVSMPRVSMPRVSMPRVSVPRISMTRSSIQNGQSNKRYFLVPLIFLFLLFVGGPKGYAETYTQIDGGFRSFPMSTSAQIQYVYNQKLWNGATEEKPWLFGVWKVAGFAAIHGQAGLRFEVYPISFLRLSLQKALTSRFYEVQTLDCQFVECGGWVDRTSMRADLALAYRDWFLVPSLERVILGPVESGKNFASEEDNLVADRSGDQLLKWQVAFGFKEGPRKFILLHQENQMSKSTDHSQASYFIYSADWSHDWSYFAGMGSFGSTHAKDSLSLVAGFKWTHGESVSLF